MVLSERNSETGVLVIGVMYEGGYACDVMCEAQSLCTSVTDMTQASRNTYDCPQDMTRYNEEEVAPI